ncbi:MAG: RNase adapter RapZ [Gammaproteobacteria bacterium]|nr:RNase adapter RapZ [Gammaproteobacteria bacterium]
MNLVIVSGLSGSGKTIALQALEDLDYYCIDNLPIGMLHAFAEQITTTPDVVYDKYAVGIDARNLAPNLGEFPTILAAVRAMRIDTQVFYLSADDVTLIKRFSETRRKHPLTSDRLPLNEAIVCERIFLEPIVSNADLVIDTSHTTVHQLREHIRSRTTASGSGAMSILLQSFGFKHGIPIDANFVFDVRCVTNPYWVPELRRNTGQEQMVVDYLESHEDVKTMYADLKAFILKWLPSFEQEKRSYMTIAIGCTGGYHRSVYFAEKLAAELRAQGKTVLVRHRELSP